MAEFSLVEPGSDLHEAHNKLLLRDSGAANYGTRIIWTDYGGDTKDRRTGVVTSTGDHTLWIENQGGSHIKVSESGSSGGNIIFNLLDSGLTVDTLEVTGNATVDGDLNVKGNTTLGDAAGDTVTVSGPATFQDDVTIKNGSGGAVLAFFDPGARVIFGTGTALGTAPNDLFSVVGSRAYFAGASEIYEIGLRYGATTGTVFLGATNSATPDWVQTNNSGTQILRGMNGGGLIIGTDAAFAGAEKLRITSGGARFEGAVTITTGGIDVTGTIVGSSTITAGTVVTAGTAFRGPNGSASVPTFSFTNDTDVGLYYYNTNQIGFAISGAIAHVVDASGWYAPNGDTTTPAYGFLSEGSLGMYRSAASKVAFVTGGTKRVEVSSAGLDVTGAITATTSVSAGSVFLAATGSLTDVSYGFTGDPNTGMYRTGADAGALVAGGVAQLTWNTSGVSLVGSVSGTTEFLGGNGTKTAPTFSFTGDTDTGVYRVAANQLGLSAGDTLVLTATTAGVDVTGAFTGSSTGVFTGLVTGAGFTVSGSNVITPAAVSGTPAAHGLYRDNVVKGWITANFAGTISASYNVSSISDDGAGAMTVQWDRDFASSSYACVASAQANGSGTAATTYAISIHNSSKTAGQQPLICRRVSDGAATDADYMLAIACGGQ